MVISCVCEAAYCVELKALVSFFIVVPDGPVVLIHHDAGAAPIQVHIDYYSESMGQVNCVPISFLFSAETSS